MIEKVTEKMLLDILKDLFERKRTSNLRKVLAKVNLSTKRFQEIWEDWWEGETPPKEEVDLILVFQELDKPFLVGIEVEYFRGRRSPYSGLEQVLSYGLFGFDSLVLWHVFAPSLENKFIERYVKPVRELVEGFNLPVVYIATKFFEDGNFEYFHPFSTSFKYSAIDLLSNLKRSCINKTNPLLYNDEVRKRKDVLKVILNIPG